MNMQSCKNRVFFKEFELKIWLLEGGFSLGETIQPCVP
jgi:hypothetical protein